MSDANTIPTEEAVRIAKAERLRAEGINPYPSATRRDTMVGEALSHFDTWAAEKKSVIVAGRLRSIRAHGGAAFVDLEDQSGKIQLHIKSDVIGETSFNRFMNDIDHADFIEAEGTLFLTQRGQQSIEVTSWGILSKALLPLPEKWHGLSDVEIRYRKRYLDLLANPEVFEIFRTRSLIVQKIRESLQREGFMEVETPILQTIAGGASAKPFITHHNALDMNLYLRIAPELFLKRLIVGGYEKVFEMARCFRNEGISFQHNPEFTQVEFYWAYATYEDLMKLTERMLTEIVTAVTGGKMAIERDGKVIDFTAPFPRKTFYALVHEGTGIDLAKDDTEEKLRKAIKAKKLKLDADAAVGFGELCDLLYKTFVRPHIVHPTFVTDYPAAMIALAKRKEGKESDRIATVQLVVQGIEITKAYNELNDPLEQQANFAQEEMKKGKGSDEAMASDADFIEALKHGMPPTAGFGMGIERLTALLTGSHSIKEVMLFPTMRPPSAEASGGGPVKPRSTDMPAFDQIKAKLDAAGAKYETKHHAADAMSHDAFGLSDAMHAGAKAIILKAKKSGAFHLFVLPADLKVDQKKVKAIIGENVSFATAEEVKEVTGCVPGSVPPFGSVIGMQTRMDKRLAENKEIFFNAGSLTDSIKMPFADYERVEKPEAVDITL